GRQKLNKAKAEAALDRLARKLGLDVIQTAMGAFKIVNSHMADLVRKVSIERGYDPRHFVLFSFGGAGPTHCPFFGRELGVKSVYIPNYSSVFSALGMLTGGIVHSLQMSYPARFPLSEEGIGNINRIYRRMKDSLSEQFTREGIDAGKVTFSSYAYMKYRLQATELPVLLGDTEIRPDNQEAIVKVFEEKYAGVYGKDTGYPEAGIEILKYRMDGFFDTPVPQIARELSKAPPDPSLALKGKRRAYFETPGDFLETPVYDSLKLRYGHVLKGPVIVERMGDTVVLPPDTVGYVDEYLNIKIEL
ncbi:MAG: hydantoinase/oxoprolinase family protein, partial [Dehalococcoidia bacterium]|nr:hydantoinase/oxoprolinase family protein [Dehalococcoidia bacterium]